MIDWAKIHVLASAGRWADMAAACEEALAQDPQEFELHCYLGQAYTGLGRHADALSAADSAVACEPNEEWPHRLRAIALSNLDRDTEAVGAARECVRLCPDRSHAWTLLSRRLVYAAPKNRIRKPERDRILQEAGQAADYACTLSPHTADPHFARALVALAFGNYAFAREACRHGLTIEPDSASGHNLLARIEYAAGDVTAASEHYVTAGRLDPSNPHAIKGLRSLKGRIPAFGIITYFAIRFAIELFDYHVVLGVVAVVAVVGTLFGVYLVRQHRFRTRQLSPEARAALAADRATRRWWQRAR